MHPRDGEPPPSAVSDARRTAVEDILDSVDARICRYRVADLQVRYCNAAWAASFGAPADELVGRTLSEILDPEDLAAVVAWLPTLLRHGSLGAHEHTRTGTRGTEIVESWTDRVIETDGALEIITSAHDVTDRARSTDALVAAEARARALVESLPVPAYRRTRGGVITQVNPAAAAWLGRSSESLVGTDVVELIAPADRDRVRDYLIAETLPDTDEVRFVCGDQTRVAALSASELTIDGVAEVLVVLHDITDAHATHRDLDAARQRTELVLAALDTAVLLHDGTGRIEMANSAAAAMFGESDPVALVGTHTDTWLSDALHESGRPLGASAAIIRRALEIGPTHLELGLPSDDGVRWLRATAVAVPGPRGETSVVCGLTDVTASHDDRMALSHAALTDPLTGLANRSALVADLSAALAGEPDGAILFIDLDRFKPVNDLYGHETGDQLLVAVAGRLRGAVAATDTVARVGGDEFVVLVHGLPDRSALDALTGRLRAVLRAPFHLEGIEVAIDASIGAALLDAGSHPDDVLGTADRHMYAAKRRHHRESAVASGEGPLTWSVALALGVETMDREHHELVVLLGRVARAIADDDASSALAALDALADHTVEHFASEEALMEEAAYPAISGHRVEHRRLLASVGRYRDDLAAGVGPSPALLVVLLSEWLGNHISGADRVFADFLHRYRPELSAPRPSVTH
ncbi:MAG TPA: bacteriohemerythrin [Acidimicrobiales bacterium]|nr:bacteriohemerythrin [Acidimicrobiales bacterium]